MDLTPSDSRKEKYSCESPVFEDFTSSQACSGATPGEHATRLRPGVSAWKGLKGAEVPPGPGQAYSQKFHCSLSPLLTAKMVKSTVRSVFGSRRVMWHES